VRHRRPARRSNNSQLGAAQAVRLIDDQSFLGSWQLIWALGHVCQHAITLSRHGVRHDTLFELASAEDWPWGVSVHCSSRKAAGLNGVTCARRYVPSALRPSGMLPYASGHSQVSWPWLCDHHSLGRKRFGACLYVARSIASMMSCADLASLVCLTRVLSERSHVANSVQLLGRIF
jgi:hypothetical protein